MPVLRGGTASGGRVWEPGSTYYATSGPALEPPDMVPGSAGPHPPEGRSHNQEIISKSLGPTDGNGLLTVCK